jgi:hypothetical protein
MSDARVRSLANNGRGAAGWMAAAALAKSLAVFIYSGSSSPEPPISFGKSFIFGSPSLMLSTFSP